VTPESSSLGSVDIIKYSLITNLGVVQALRRHGAPKGTTGHSARVSSATDMFLSKATTFEGIMAIGRWQSVSSVGQYVRMAVVAATF